MSDTENTEVQVVDMDDLDAFSNDFFGQKDTTPTPTKVEEPEQDTEHDESTEVVEDQKTDVDPEDEDPEAEYVEPPPKKKTVQDRIDELVKQREDAKREAAAELQKLREEFEQYKNGVTKPAAATKPVSDEPQPDDVKEDGSPKYELGEFDPQYIRDLTRHTLQQERIRVQTEEVEAQRTRELSQAQAELQTSWNAKIETSKELYPDLVEKGTALLNNFNDLPQEYAGYLSSVLMSMDKGPDVLYYLSNHPDEANRP